MNLLAGLSPHSLRSGGFPVVSRPIRARGRLERPEPIPGRNQDSEPEGYEFLQGGSARGSKVPIPGLEPGRRHTFYN